MNRCLLASKPSWEHGPGEEDGVAIVGGIDALTWGGGCPGVQPERPEWGGGASQRWMRACVQVSTPSSPMSPGCLLLCAALLCARRRDPAVSRGDVASRADLPLGRTRLQRGTEERQSWAEQEGCVPGEAPLHPTGTLHGHSRRVEGHGVKEQEALCAKHGSALTTGTGEAALEAGQCPAAVQTAPRVGEGALSADPALSHRGTEGTARDGGGRKGRCLLPSAPAAVCGRGFSSSPWSAPSCGRPRTSFRLPSR